MLLLEVLLVHAVRLHLGWKGIMVIPATGPSGPVRYTQEGACRAWGIGCHSMFACWGLRETSLILAAGCRGLGRRRGERTAR